MGEYCEKNGHIYVDQLDWRCERCGAPYSARTPKPEPVEETSALAEELERLLGDYDNVQNETAEPALAAWAWDNRECLLAALRKPAEPVGDEELAKIVHENGPVVVDAMGEGLAWRPLDYGTWTELAALSSTPEREALQAENERLKAMVGEARQVIEGLVCEKCSAPSCEAARTFLSTLTEGSTDE